MRTLLTLTISLLPVLSGIINTSAFAYAVETTEGQNPTALREQEINPRPALKVPDSALASKAQNYIRTLNLKKPNVSSTEAAASVRGNLNPRDIERTGDIQKLDEIRVLDQVAPEDYVAPKIPPMLAFRARLDRQRPMTPQEVIQGVLCFIALCQIDTSKELRIDDRNEARAKNPPSFAGQP